MLVANVMLLLVPFMFSSGVTITSNIIKSMMSAGVYFHCGTDNSATNNIVAEVDVDKAGFLGKGETQLGW